MKKEYIDKKAREAIIRIANALYGNILSMDFIQGLADYLFIVDKKKNKKALK